MKIDKDTFIHGNYIIFRVDGQWFYYQPNKIGDLLKELAQDLKMVVGIDPDLEFKRIIKRESFVKGPFDNRQAAEERIFVDDNSNV